MKPNQQLPLQQIKRIYRQAIENIIIKSVRDEGIIDFPKARASIEYLWAHQFMTHYSNLNLSSIYEIWSIFDKTMADLDRCEDQTHSLVTHHSEAYCHA